MLGLTVRGDYQGKSVTLWGSLVSGMEIISVDGREVSRKRNFGFSSTHDLSGSGLDIDRAMVKSLPLRLDLQKGGEVVATFRLPTPTFVLVVALCLLCGAAASVGVQAWLSR